MKCDKCAQEFKEKPVLSEGQKWATDGDVAETDCCGAIACPYPAAQETAPNCATCKKVLALAYDKALVRG